ncbi:MoaF N-terminal domain-containing protein [Paraglaciecola sp. 20A4]|uniref:phenolic acid decarboxylase n=1 Tax=Paraglaciecola sp. 20A4 TaxID=2687288 RepID=UPI00140DFFA7|nr:MoaF N-terminal domain-containing protein [Paraglaciecola sp. 20A4]
MNKFILLISILLFSINAMASDELVEPTRKLNGSEITYEYTSGRSYNVKFEEAGISYRYLTGSKPETWWGPFPYQAFEIEKEIYMLSWFEAGYGDYVTLLVNFNNRLVYGSAIISGKEVHFHGARIKIVNP